jgi:purine-nucleoside phosphorylase
MSLITDLGVDGKIVEITHEEVQRVANESADKMSSIVKHLVAYFGK